ncbi:hypothetical protein [Peribacillus alkalitolerans]|uniref:hypothetical protein n=1 Tax=Peribacillus alkalitolerans TaxID=1550385 RepID=UPI0013D4E4EE|nr:hypothetical protein [Peribacillus alkalitolerans]
MGVIESNMISNLKKLEKSLVPDVDKPLQETFKHIIKTLEGIHLKYQHLTVDLIVLEGL